jgi:hypothetical protein
MALAGFKVLSLPTTHRRDLPLIKEPSHISSLILERAQWNGVQAVVIQF